MGIDHDALQKSRSGARQYAGWRPQDGANRVRILPPSSAYFREDISYLALAYKTHFFQIDGQPTEVSRCLQDLGKKCPACETWRRHHRSTDPGFAEMARRVSPSDQYLFNILDLGDLPAGLQRFTSNWTIWDKVMEIAANPQWGDVLDLQSGVTFGINKTPANKTRSGYPAYSVVPEPERVDVRKVIAAIPNFADELDALVDSFPTAKDPEEIIALLAEVGFPEHAERVGRGVFVPGSGTPPTLSPTPPAASAPPPPTAPGSVDAPAQRPECFGGYNPAVHPCPGCPVQADCQMKYLGLA